MSKIKAIRTEAEHEQALARIDALMDAVPGTPRSEELDALVDLVELYEQKNVPMGLPSRLAAMEFRMEQSGATARNRRERAARPPGHRGRPRQA